MIQTLTFWLVLAIAVAVYWILPARLRMAWLAAVSLLYVVALDLKGIAPLIGWALLVFVLRRRIAGEGRLAGLLVIGLIVSLIIHLAWFKYLPQLAALIAAGPSGGGLTPRALIPIGISFITFKLIHYVLETQRRTLPDHGFAEFAGWILLFPTWTAGPIERFDHFLAHREPALRGASLTEGATRIAYGMIKKFVLGLQLVPLLFGEVSSGAELIARLPELGMLGAWRFLIVSFLLLYLDFSAYSDIAIGASRLFGLGIMENFALPILAPNPAIYWKRWHMTLSAWCQSYVFMPVVALTRNPYLSVFAAFTVIGIWHSGTWNWLAWGLYHASAVVLYQVWSRWRRRRKLTFFDHPAVDRAGVALTLLYTSAAGAFTTIQGVGRPWDGLRILAKLAAIDLPA